MGRVSFDDVDNYSTSTGSSFFKLEQNGQKAIVRFLLRSVADLEILAVHEINVDNKFRKVSCLRSFNDPVQNCPLCSCANKDIAKIQVKYFIPMIVYTPNGQGGYNQDVQLWERGKNFKADITNMMNLYNPLCDYPIEITRNGEARSMQTTYTFLPIMNPQIVNSIPPVDWSSVEIPQALGTIVMDKSYDELTYFLSNGKFPVTTGQQNSGYVPPMSQPNVGYGVPTIPTPAVPQQPVQQPAMGVPAGYGVPPAGPIPGTPVAPTAPVPPQPAQPYGGQPQAPSGFPQGARRRGGI